MTLAALCTIARLHQVAADPAALAHQLGLSASDPIQIDDLLRGAKMLGLKAKLKGTGRLLLIPSLVKHRKLLGEVLFISFMLQLFALVSPLRSRGE